MTQNPHIARFQIRTQTGGLILRTDNPALLTLLPSLQLEQQILGTPRYKDKSLVISHPSLDEPLRISPQNKHFDALCAAIHTDKKYVMSCLEGRSPIKNTRCKEIKTLSSSTPPPLLALTYQTPDINEGKFGDVESHHEVDGSTIQQAVDRGALLEQEKETRDWKNIFHNTGFSR